MARIIRIRQSLSQYREFGSSKLLVFAMILGLSGCVGSQRDYDYFLAHPKDVLTTINACRLMPSDKASSDPECASAVKAKETLSNYLLDYQDNPTLFGQKIMQLQTDITQKKQQLTNFKVKNETAVQLKELKQNLSDQQRELNTLYTVIRMTTRI